MSSKVFISYSSKDKEFVKKLIRELNRKKVNIWIDEFEIKVGDSIIEKITEGLSESSYLIIVLSKHSLKSKWVEKELKISLMLQLNKGAIKIFPLLYKIDFDEIPLFLQDIKGLKIDDEISENAISGLIEPILHSQKGVSVLELQSTFFRGAEYIDEILLEENPSIKKVNVVIELLSKDSFRNYFLKRVNSVEWLSLLQKLGYFNPINIPNVEEQVIRGQKTRMIPFWRPLTYLELLSSRPSNDRRIQDSLVGIIKDVSEYIYTHEEKYDNRIFWYFIKILSNLPEELITNDVIELIPNWVRLNWDRHLISSEIMENLLPKLLNENQKKALKLIQIITSVVKIKEEKSVFSPGYSFELLLDKYWLEEGFKKNSELITEKCGVHAIKKILENIDVILRKSETSIYFDEDEKELVFKERKTHYMLSYESRQVDIKKNEIDNIFSDILEKEPLRVLSSSKEFKYINSKVHKLMRNHFGLGTWNSFWDDKEYALDSLDVLTKIIKNLALEIVNMEEYLDDLFKLLPEFLIENYLYYPKFALYIIGCNVKAFSEVFVQFVGEKYLYIFESTEFHDEIRHILEGLQNYKEEILTGNILEKLETLINKIPQYHYYLDDPDGYGEDVRQRYYNALSWCPKYEKMITKETKLAPIIGKAIVTTGIPEKDQYIISIEELNRKNNNEISKILKNKKTSNSEFWRIFETAISIEPFKYSIDMKPFRKAPYCQLEALFNGFEKAIKDGNRDKIKFENLLNFIQEMLEDEEFWLDKYNTKNYWGSSKHTDVLREIYDLLSKILHETTEIYANYSEMIIDILSRLLKSELSEIGLKRNLEVTGDRDILNFIMLNNSASVLRVGFFLLLKLMNLKNPKYSENIRHLKGILLKEMDILIKTKNVVGYSILGYFATNFLAIDKEYIERHVNSAMRLNDIEIWKYFMEGYICRSLLNEDSYLLMKENLSYALDNMDIIEVNSRERLIQQLSLYYLWGYEGTSSGLLYNLLMKNNPEYITELLYYLWSLKDEILMRDRERGEKGGSRILEIWKCIYEEYKEIPKEELTDDQKKMLSVLGNLAVYLVELKKSFKLLKLSAPWSDYYYNSHYFIEYINNLKNKGNNHTESAKYISEIYLAMLAESTPTYYEEHIIEIVEYLYRNPPSKKDADRICNIYGERGNNFLKPTYDKYNK